MNDELISRKAILEQCETLLQSKVAKGATGYKHGLRDGLRLARSRIISVPAATSDAETEARNNDT